jgi:uncharacterized membrane protein
MKTMLDKNDKIWETIALVLLLTQALIIGLTLPSLPDKVAIHFNDSGQADGWGNKNTLWLSLGLSVLMYAFLTFVSYRPELYKSRMTKNNLDEQYRLTSKMARTVKSFILLGFIALTTFMLMTAQGKWTVQIPFLFLIFFALVIPPCLYYAIKISKVQ